MRFVLQKLHECGLMQVPTRLNQTSNMISTCIPHGKVRHSIKEYTKFKQTLQDLMDMQLFQVGCCYDSNVNMIDKLALGDNQVTQGPQENEIAKLLTVIPKPLTIHYTKMTLHKVIYSQNQIQIPSPFPYKDSIAAP